MIKVVNMGHQYDMGSIEDGFEDEERIVGCGKRDGDSVCNFSDCDGCPLEPRDSPPCLKERETVGLEVVTVVITRTFAVVPDDES